MPESNFQSISPLNKIIKSQVWIDYINAQGKKIDGLRFELRKVQDGRYQLRVTMDPLIISGVLVDTQTNTPDSENKPSSYINLNKKSTT